jgi:uncharacterized protein YecT (DUF1311 family)
MRPHILGCFLIVAGLWACHHTPPASAAPSPGASSPSAAPAAAEGPDTASARSLPCWEKAATQAEINDCAASEARQAETEMNDVLNGRLQQVAGDAVALKKLEAAQAAWLAYRDAELAARFPSDQPQSEYGSVFPTCWQLARARLFQDRTRALRVSSAEGDVCAAA